MTRALQVHAVAGPGAMFTACGMVRPGNSAIRTSIRFVDLTCPTCINTVREDKGFFPPPGVEPADHDKGRSPANFPHDCEACVYLDSVDGKDLYFCSGSSAPTVIARYGESPEDYESGLAFVTKEPHLALALVLALKQGLIQFGDVLRRL